MPLPLPEQGFMLLAFGIGGLVGIAFQQITFRFMCLKEKGLPWRARGKLARYFGFGKFAIACDNADRSERSVYATIVVGTFVDLGGQRLMLPKSKEAYEGFITEVESRYALSCQKRNV